MSEIQICPYCSCVHFTENLEKVPKNISLQLFDTQLSWLHTRKCSGCGFQIMKTVNDIEIKTICNQ